MGSERDTPDGSPVAAATDVDEGAKAAEAEPAGEREGRSARGPRRGVRSIVVLLFLGLAAFYVATLRPREQHVRVVLGSEAPQVSAVELRYVASDGEVAREARFTYTPGRAPRVVAHEPELPDGDYRLEIDLDARDGRRTVQRQVTLGGGSTQVDVSDVLRRRDPETKPANGDEAR